MVYIKDGKRILRTAQGEREIHSTPVFDNWMQVWSDKLDELMRHARQELTRDMAIRVTDQHLSASGHCSYCGSTNLMRGHDINCPNAPQTDEEEMAAFNAAILLERQG
jgi:hypothetical protein